MLSEIEQHVRNFTEHHPLEIWWRDDDFGQLSPNALQLFKSAKEHQIPLLVAVVPYRLAVSDKEFQKKISGNGYGDFVAFGVHGFDHFSHDAENPSEYPAGRDADTVRNELHYGIRRVRQTFAHMMRPFFVPPWNKIAVSHIEILKEEGYALLSSVDDWYLDQESSGFRVCNIDLDLLDYSERPFRIRKPHQIVESLKEILASRREMESPPTCLGLLTHHVEMVPEDIDLVGDMIEAMKAGGAKATKLDSLFGN